MLLAVANNDANRQLEQVNNFIAKGVDGIVIAPKDAQSVVPIIKAANKAGIPIVLYNRPPGRRRRQVRHGRRRQRGDHQEDRHLHGRAGKGAAGKYKALILIGDLADINADRRRDGFDEAIKPYGDLDPGGEPRPHRVEPGEGAGRRDQRTPGQPRRSTSSSPPPTSCSPSIVSALKQAGSTRKSGEDGHVLLGGFDGDATAYRMLVDGYLDADGVQDVVFECKQSVQAVFDLKAGKDLPAVIRDPGFVIHQGNLEEAKKNMWGACRRRSEDADLGQVQSRIRRAERRRDAMPAAAASSAAVLALTGAPLRLVRRTLTAVLSEHSVLLLAATYFLAVWAHARRGHPAEPPQPVPELAAPARRGGRSDRRDDQRGIDLLGHVDHRGVQRDRRDA